MRRRATARLWAHSATARVRASRALRRLSRARGPKATLRGLRMRCAARSLRSLLAAWARVAAADERARVRLVRLARIRAAARVWLTAAASHTLGKFCTARAAHRARRAAFETFAVGYAVSRGARVAARARLCFGCQLFARRRAAARALRTWAAWNAEACARGGELSAASVRARHSACARGADALARMLVPVRFQAAGRAHARAVAARAARAWRARAATARARGELGVRACQLGRHRRCEEAWQRWRAAAAAAAARWCESNLALQDAQKAMAAWCPAATGAADAEPSALCAADSPASQQVPSP